MSAFFAPTPTLFFLLASPTLSEDLEAGEPNQAAYSYSLEGLSLMITLEVSLRDRVREGDLTIRAKFGWTLPSEVADVDPAELAKELKRSGQAYGDALQLECAGKFDLYPTGRVPAQAKWAPFGPAAATSIAEQVLELTAGGD